MKREQESNINQMVECVSTRRIKRSQRNLVVPVYALMQALLQRWDEIAPD
jgi:hypothetical protein